MMNHVGSKVKKNICTGCSVCSIVCPHKVISMVESQEGFHYPKVNETSCTNCGLCVKKCHAYNENIKINEEQEIYDVRASDEIRMKSSSGGFFTIAADYVFENKGYVCGAAFSKDFLSVEHIIINNKKDLDKLRGSKYVESSLNDIFIQIKKLLTDNNLVLFSGCPCQVSALNHFLGKDYENLLTIDLFCNSIVPQKVWRKYLKETIKNDISNIEHIGFREKSKIGWGGGVYIRVNKYDYLPKDQYMMAFLQHISVKEECLHCKYRKSERAGDISIGDYWGVKEHDGKGVSLVLVNSNKGKKFFENIKSNFKYIKISKKDLPKNDNLSHFGLIIQKYPFSNRKYFFDNLEKEDFNSLFINSKKFDVGLIGFWFCNNYGAVLTYYALYKLLQNFGLSVLVIDTVDKKASNYQYFNAGMPRKFASKHYPYITEQFEGDKFASLNNRVKSFILSSDQLWNTILTKPMTSSTSEYLYFLDFANDNIKKIAIGTSIGDDNFLEENKKPIIKYYLKKFDNIFLREKAGADLLNENLGVQADNILDPVYLIDRNEYDNLIKESELKKNNYIFVYAFSRTPEYIKKFEILAKQFNKELVVSTFREKPEDWLYLIKNAYLVITESFHGTSFAIIYNKPFVTFRGDYYSSNLYRIREILNTFGLENRLISTIDYLIGNNEFFQKNNIFNHDYTNINKKIEELRIKDINLIKEAINNNSKKDNDKNSYLFDMLIKENLSLKNIINNIKTTNDNIAAENNNINNNINSNINNIININNNIINMKGHNP